MLNFNDAEITRVFVSQTASPSVPDDTPNAPSGGDYDVTIEMVAGTGVQNQTYKLNWGCVDLITGAAAPAGLLAGVPKNGDFGQGAGWTAAGPLNSVFSATATIPLAPGAGADDLYQYVVTLTSNNGQVTSHIRSEPFQLF